MKSLLLAVLVCLLLVPAVRVAAQVNGEVSTITVPGFQAYSEPDAEALTISKEKGVAGWTSAKDKVVWYGLIRAKGTLEAAVTLRFPASGASSRLRLTVAPNVTQLPAAIAVSHEASAAAAAATASDASAVTVSFGAFPVTRTGYYRFALEGVSKTGATFGEIESLHLSGTAAKDALFLQTTQRGAPSVHLSYPVPPEAQVVLAYDEVTAKADPLWTYYCALGFRRGYFGIQVNSPTERRIIFSVWDSGGEAVDRSRVAAADRVQLIAKGKGVFTDSFGNEGTGGHSHLVYPWKTGSTYRFIVTARPEGRATVYAGYFYFPEKKQWGLIAAFRAPNDGDFLRGLYSFDEDFNGSNGQKRRYAEFGNQWVRTTDGAWKELTTARFTHTAREAVDRLDYGAGAWGSRFYLAGGGFITDFPIKYGDMVYRPAADNPPTGVSLPPLPVAKK